MGCFNQLFGINACVSGDFARVEGRQRCFQGIQSLDLCCDKVFVIAFFFENDASDCAEYQWILAGPTLQVDIGLFGALGFTRIDNDEFHAALTCVK